MVFQAHSQVQLFTMLTLPYWEDYLKTVYMMFESRNPTYPWHLDSKNMMLENVNVWKYNNKHVWLDKELDKILIKMTLSCLAYCLVLKNLGRNFILFFPQNTLLQENFKISFLKIPIVLSQQHRWKGSKEFRVGTIFQHGIS